MKMKKKGQTHHKAKPQMTDGPFAYKHSAYILNINESPDLLWMSLLQSSTRPSKDKWIHI